MNAERLRAFALDDLDAQRQALAILRARAARDGEHLAMALVGIVVAVIAAFGIPMVTAATEVPTWLTWGGVTVVAVITFAFVMHAMAIIGQGSKERSYAAAWVGAYEDELARWRDMPGRAGREWRKSH
ncbi:hypothetical protein IF188_03060 [Microbacterium sp. NEAU-LLC]|uniref:Phage holin family protein n=1 Tax=Microbacterium helvum TaxID=2773713 RepID=A0ABR8NJ21_9MICO|nr:hypothetical protein [Microbacterium helvum]MBD3940677.1 hypothetical protein [Microbacterium helvum]